MLSVSNLSISFDENHVLDGFNLDLESGDIFALLGLKEQKYHHFLDPD